MADATAKSAPNGAESGRERLTRDEELRQRRAARDPGTLDANRTLKLAIPDAIRAANPGQHFRWSNDMDNRIHFLTEVDFYSKVDGMEPVPVGTDAAGKPLYAHLLRKPLDMFREDQSRKSDAIKANEQSLVRGAEPGSKIGES